MAVDYDRLARAHMAKQVADTARIQAAMVRLWDETIDPADLTGSFTVFRERALPLIESGRSISKAEAQRYFEAMHNVSGLDSKLADVYEKGWSPRFARSSLSYVAGKPLARAEAIRRAGGDPTAELEKARDAVLGSAKRHVLNSGRERIIGLTKTTGYGRWARVSDGAPCAFCLMLVGRGPVYTSTTATFRSHDRCGCSARPVLATESGWSEQARQAQALYRKGNGLVGLRQLLAEERESEPAPVVSITRSEPVAEVDPALALLLARLVRARAA
ncbi:head maturation protease [Microbacterium phage phiMiGM15]